MYLIEKDKYKIIENFCNRILIEKRFHKHSEIDFNIILKLKGIKNLHNLFNEEEKHIIENNIKNNLEYLDKIQKYKNSIVKFDEKDRNNISSKTFSELSLFDFDNFEIYFKAELIVNGVILKPEITTDIYFTEQFTIPLNFRFKIKDLTQEAYIKIYAYTTQLPEKVNFLGACEIRIFDSNTMTMLQGKQIRKLFNKEEIKVLKKNNLNTNTNNISDVNEDNNNDNSSINNKNEDKDNLLNKLLLSKQRENSLNYLTQNYYKYSTNNGMNSNFTIKNDYINNENEYNKKIEDSKTDSTAFLQNFKESEQKLLYESTDSYIELEFMNFDFPVIYEEEKYPVYQDYYTSYTTRPGKDFIYNNKENWVCDFEIRKNNNYLIKQNPIINKFVLLSRISDDAIAKDIRPDHKQSKLIDQLIPTPDFIKLAPEESYLFWKFRYHLLNRKNCLTKILNSVNWGESKSENEFLNNILSQWSVIDISDILYMLSFKFCVNPLYVKHIHSNMNKVRIFAVNQLSKLSNDEIEFVLLQLVQALRYEDPESSSLKNYLIKRCFNDITLATSLFWFLNVEADEEGETKERELKVVAYYKEILELFKNKMSDTVSEGISSQLELRNKLINVANEIRKYKSKEQKTTKLPNIIKQGGICDLTNLGNATLPIMPKAKVTSVIPEKILIFDSAKWPIKYSLKVSSDTQQYVEKDNPSIYDIMFKYGDDLRQDQLILQIIAYMDNLLRKVKIDMEFTTYKVVATSKSDGFVEFVSNVKTIRDILKENNNSITPFLENNAQKLGLSFDSIMESYINSCAGYCVVTYILGIGDRHLENILINSRGRLFHIDFGFILGKDPKPYPPPVKLSEQMVECMGKENLSKFKKKCCDVYLYLRQNSRLIVNMFYLMINCGITELSENYETVLKKLHDKFVPNMNNEEASNSLNTKLEESVSAFFTKIVDYIHEWAKYMK